MIDRAPLGLEEVKERSGVSFGYHERMEFSHWMFVTDRERKRVESDDPLVWNFAKNAIGLARVNPLANYPEICIVTRAFVRVALEAQRLKVG